MFDLRVKGSYRNKKKLIWETNKMAPQEAQVWCLFFTIGKFENLRIISKKTHFCNISFKPYQTRSYTFDWKGTLNDSFPASKRPFIVIPGLCPKKSCNLGVLKWGRIQHWYNKIKNFINCNNKWLVFLFCSSFYHRSLLQPFVPHHMLLRPI